MDSTKLYYKTTDYVKTKNAGIGDNAVVIFIDNVTFDSTLGGSPLPPTTATKIIIMTKSVSETQHSKLTEKRKTICTAKVMTVLTLDMPEMAAPTHQHP